MNKELLHRLVMEALNGSILSEDIEAVLRVAYDEGRQAAEESEVLKCGHPKSCWIHTEDNRIGRPMAAIAVEYCIACAAAYEAAEAMREKAAGVAEWWPDIGAKTPTGIAASIRLIENKVYDRKYIFRRDE